MCFEILQEYKLCVYFYMEVYDGGFIYFMAFLVRQNEFYVFEVQEEEERVDEGDDEDDDSFVDDSVLGKVKGYLLLQIFNKT